MKRLQNKIFKPTIELTVYDILTLMACMSIIIMLTVFTTIGTIRDMYEKHEISQITERCHITNVIQSKSETVYMCERDKHKNEYILIHKNELTHVGNIYIGRPVNVKENFKIDPKLYNHTDNIGY